MREVRAAAADLGDSLVLVRDCRLFENQGFSSFESWCEGAFPATLPANWKLDAGQVEQLIVVALKLATERRAGEGVNPDE